MDYPGIFEELASDETDIRLASRKALRLSQDRIDARLGSFLVSRSPEEYDARYSYVEGDFKGIIDVACQEVGHGRPEAIVQTLHAHYRPTPPVEHTAEVHESRKPKMCPYHSEVTDISLGSGDPKAGFEVMRDHAWGDHHCQGTWEGGKCKFRREMVTQTYWDDRQKELDERRDQRMEQGIPEDNVVDVLQDEITEPAEESLNTEPVPEGGDIIAPSDSGEVVDVDFGGGESEVSAPADSAPLAVAASSKQSKKVPCPECGGDGKTANNSECPKCHGAGRVNDWGGSTLDALEGKTAAGYEGADPPPSSLGYGQYPGDNDDQRAYDHYAQTGEKGTLLDNPGGMRNCPACMGQGDYHVATGEPNSAPLLDEGHIKDPLIAPHEYNRIYHGKTAGEDTCPRCKGSGKQASGAPCTYCGGTGNLKGDKSPTQSKTADKGNTDLGGPEPTMDKRRWTPQTVKEIDVPSKYNPTKRKDPIEPIKGTNDSPLKEIGEQTTERVDLNGENSESGYGTGGVDKAPGTLTWPKGKKEVDPVTASRRDENPLIEYLGNSDGFVSSEAVQRAISLLS